MNAADIKRSLSAVLEHEPLASEVGKMRGCT
jgi:hypothetical protein